MSDPISPTGSPGQQPIMVPGSTITPPTPLPSGVVGSSPVSEPRKRPEGLQEAVVLELEASRAQKTQESPSDSQSLEKSVKEFRDFLKNLPSDLKINMDEESGQIVFKLVNPVTKEVIRQFPPEEIVEMARKLRTLFNQQKQSGIFLDKKS